MVEVRFRRRWLVPLVLLLLIVPGAGAAAAPLHPSPAAPLPSPTEKAPPGVAHPAATALYDWDPQPFVLPPSFPASQIAGEGAVAATSDRYGTVLLFGGESPSGLTNLTVTANQSTGYWNVGSIPVAPSPRTNASLVTVDGGRFAILFGGLTNLSSGATDNQTWRFDYLTRTWHQMFPPVSPPAREGAAFASDDGLGVAVLEGGLTPSTSYSGGGASVTWNDTWVLNLATFTWSRSGVSGAPRPAFGASMFDVPVTRSFYLFGGCAVFCSSALYVLHPGGNWSLLPAGGEVPPPRGGASMAWSPVWNLSVLFGGFIWGANSYAPYNDTYVFDPVLDQWSLVLTVGPTGRFAAASTYLSANQCPGLLLVGGSSALAQSPPDGWFLDSNPDLGNGCNNWGGDQAGGPGGGGGGNCSNATTLIVRVLNGSSSAPLYNATVSVTGLCGGVILRTNSLGFATFPGLPNETVRVAATDTGYHSNQTYLNLSGALVHQLTMLLDPLPSVFIRTYAESYLGGLGPLGNVSVVYDGLTLEGISDAGGYLNLTAFSGAQGPATFTGLEAGYSNGTTTVSIPWTGTISFTILLQAFGALDVHVVELPDLTGVAGAAGTITPVGGYTFGSPQIYTTNYLGWFNTTLPQGNYTVSAAALGFFTTVSSPRFHPWVQPTIVQVNLTALFTSNLSVQLVDAYSGAPIGGGHVIVGSRWAANTTGNGWANFTGISPPGRYGITGSADNYALNATSVLFTYQDQHPVVILPLTPVTHCPPDCGGSPNGTSGTYRLLPPAGATLDLFVLAPVALALAGAGYAIYLRRRVESAP